MGVGHFTIVLCEIVGKFDWRIPFFKGYVTAKKILLLFYFYFYNYFWIYLLVTIIGVVWLQHTRMRFRVFIIKKVIFGSQKIVTKEKK